MRIQTQYRHMISSPEILDYDNSVTAKNQYIPLSEIISRTAKGENLMLKDYTEGNPLDCKEKFDVLDLYNDVMPRYEAEEEKKRKKKADDEDAEKRKKIIEEYEASKKTEEASKKTE